MRITLGETTLSLELFMRAGWLTLSFGRSGPGWGDSRNLELLPLGAAREHERVRRACRRQGHLWLHAPVPAPDEHRAPGWTIHKKYRCRDCGQRSSMPSPARPGSARASDA